MNTVRSFWIGWGSLCVAGAGAYYFAKKEIAKDRRAKLDAQRKKKEADNVLQYGMANPADLLKDSSSSGGNGGPARTDSVGSPSQEASHDPAPTGHAPVTEGQRVTEKSKYETSTPFRSRKGDRFS